MHRSDSRRPLRRQRAARAAWVVLLPVLVLGLASTPSGANSAPSGPSGYQAIPIPVGPGGASLAPLDAGLPAPRVSEEELEARLQRVLQAAGDLQPTARPSATAPQGRASTTSHVPRYGGDDVLIATHAEISAGFSYSMDIAEDGTIYAAFEAFETNHYVVYIYRSTDGGDSWSQWGVKSIAAAGFDYREPSIHVAEGVQDRLFLTYRYRGGVGAALQIWVSYAPLAGANAVWTDRLVMNEAAVTYHNPEITSDEELSDSYVLFVTAHGDDGNGDDIWFTRSTDQGSTYAAEYRIRTNSSSTIDARYPRLAYGHGGILSVAWSDYVRATDTWRVTTRRAVNWAAGGEPDFADTSWQFAMTAGHSGYNVYVACSHDDDKVLVTFVETDGAVYQEANVATSANQGWTWTYLGGTLTPIPGDLHALAIPGSRGFKVQMRSGDGYGVRGSTNADPATFDEFHQFSDAPYFGSVTPGRLDSDYDPTRSYRLGWVWRAFHAATNPDSLFFDAEWRTDPGYPNLEPGFPLALSAAIISPPGICELDDDAESEIVFGDALGNVHAVNHDGTAVPGWPQNIGSIPDDGPVAVGDLDGNGVSEVVCGDGRGFVHAFDRAGAVLPGWPVDLGQAAPAYASIGAVNGAGNRQVVAASGQRLALLDGAGALQPGFPLATTAPLHAPAAIGDVDDDGDVEIVILQETFCNVISPTGGNEYFRFFGAGLFHNAPTLADLDLDGDLEIAAPTTDGRIFVLDAVAGLPDHGAWPLDVGTGSPITSVALADLAGVDEVELAFAEEQNWTAHLYFRSMAALAGWPHATGAGWFIYGMPIIETIDELSPDVLLGARDANGYGWLNLFSDVPGWPRSLGDRCNVSPASGDLDQDGKVEVVFGTLSSLVVYDLGAAIDRADRTGQWPMYAYNPQRTGCLACGADAVVAVGPRPAGGIRFSAPHPNPGSAPVLSFELPAPGAARLVVYDAAGRVVRRLLKRELPAGPHAVPWDGRSEDGERMGAGVYYVQLQVMSAQGNFRQSRKVTLLP